MTVLFATTEAPVLATEIDDAPVVGDLIYIACGTEHVVTNIHSDAYHAGECFDILAMCEPT